MTAISKSFVVIADGAVDPDSPIDAALMTGLRDNDIHLREWIGADYTAGAAQNHSHDGADSALIPIGANALRNGSFESSLVGWTTATFTGGTVAINTANAMDGVNCLAFTSTSTANGGGTATSNEFIPAAAGMSYSIRGIVKASTANVSSRIEVIWYDSAQAQISTTNAYNTTNTPTTQTEVGTELTAPATTRFYKIKITGGVPGAGSATGTIYFDQVFAQKPVTGLIRVSIITATDAAWAPLAATKTIVAHCIGAGSGGGGGQSSGGASGAGGYTGLEIWGVITSVSGTYAATVGAGGAGGAAGLNGATGGTTSFGSITTLGAQTGGQGSSGGATGGTGAGNGGGAGGASGGGAGGAATANSGAGGGGGGSNLTGTGGAGGAGGSGVIYVWEFA